MAGFNLVKFYYLSIMKKPYLEKIGSFSGFTAWKVDGEYIRGKINSEFCNFAEHYSFSFIPKSEHWIDRESVPGETGYFIDNMLAKRKLINQGVKYEKALVQASRIESRERRKNFFQHHQVKDYDTKSEILSSVRKKLIKRYSNRAINTWLVNGELVRTLVENDFSEGGHGLIYPFIPKNEIWLDDDLSAEERKFVFLHELHERNLIVNGWQYDASDLRPGSNKANKALIKKSAHLSASRIEYHCRRRPSATKA